MGENAATWDVSSGGVETVRHNIPGTDGEVIEIGTVLDAADVNQLVEFRLLWNGRAFFELHMLIIEPT